MFNLKKVSREGVTAALQKAERYRLLNEPWQAESICRDVLEIEPRNSQALVTLLLAITDQFSSESAVDVRSARTLLEGLPENYQREYYAGIICERWAVRLLRLNAPGTGPSVYAWLHEAMLHYEAAEKLRAPGDDASILRWNTCARLIQRHQHVRPSDLAPTDPIESE